MNTIAVKCGDAVQIIEVGSCRIIPDRCSRAAIGVHRGFVRVFDFHMGKVYEAPHRQGWELHQQLNNTGSKDNA